MYTIDEIRDAVKKAAEEYNATAPAEKRVVRIDLFGSYASGNQTESSDVDFLVTFATPVVGLFALAGLFGALEEHFDCSVDMVKYPLSENSFLEIERTVPVYEAA